MGNLVQRCRDKWRRQREGATTMAAIHQQHAQIARGDETIRYRWSLNGSASNRDVSNKDGSLPGDALQCLSRSRSQRLHQS